MRYKILRPTGVIDPRLAGFGSLGELFLQIPPVSEVLECPLGSGHVTLLGMIAHNASYDQDGAIPFMLFVYAVPENNRDKQSITNKRQFHGDLWKPPVLEPEADYETESYRVSIRTNSVPQYPAVRVETFRYNNKLVIYLELGESKMSMEFLDDTVRLEYGPTTVLKPDPRSIISG